MRHLTAIVLIISGFAGMAETASASHDSPLYQAADAYRDAVKAFERGVIRARYFDRYDVRLVDRLEDTTSGLRSAARHPDRLDRLIREWNEIECLQPRVEAVIFDQTRYPYHPQLAQCWHAVVLAGARFSQELSLLQIPVYPHPPAVHGPVIHFAPAYRQPVQPSTFEPYERPLPDVYRGRAITIPPSVGDAPAATRTIPIRTVPTRHRVESNRGDFGHVMIGAMLTRLFD